MSDQNWQSFNVAVVNPDDDSETITPMKTWLRQHPDRYPFDPSTKNSRTIGHWLVQQGWRSMETPTEFRLYPPESPPPPDIPAIPQMNSAEASGWRLNFATFSPTTCTS